MNDKQSATLCALPWPGAMVAEVPNGNVLVAHPDHPPVIIDKDGWAEAIAPNFNAAPMVITVRRGGGIFGV